MTSLKYKAVAWDFDGVLNRNVLDGMFFWMSKFEEDLGLSVRSFANHLFYGRFQKAMVGEADLHEIVEEWAEANGVSHRRQEIIDYWFDTDHLPDPVMLSMVERVRKTGAINVVATNNEVYRADYIEANGFDHMDRFFAAGRMKLAKPDLAYFRHIEDELGLSGKDLILIDDMEENVRAAREHGWDAHQFKRDQYGELEKALGLAAAEHSDR